METGTEHTAAGTVTAAPVGPYSPENLLLYHTAMALAERLLQRGILTAPDYRKAAAIFAKRHRLPPHSLYAEQLQKP